VLRLKERASASSPSTSAIASSAATAGANSWSAPVAISSERGITEIPYVPEKPRPRSRATHTAPPTNVRKPSTPIPVPIAPSTDSAAVVKADWTGAAAAGPPGGGAGGTGGTAPA
jgi:hypothetical protein